MKEKKSIDDRATEILKEHGLFILPVDPVTLANREGIKVNNAVFSEGNLSGLIAKRGSNITILVNQSDPPSRKRFTIAHELGHHFLHLHQDGEFIDNITDLYRENETDGTSHVQEVEANQFAASLLMPSELIQNEFKEVNGNIKLLTKIFNVSEQAMMFRLKRLRLI